MSDDLLVRILEPDSTANEAWIRIQNIFLNNKGSRAAALEHEFTNLTLKSMPSLDAYCQRLKELAAQLTDVDNPVNANRLVLQLVRGLPAEYDIVASYINQTLPAWETAVSMLQLELHRQTARDSISSPPIAAAVITNPPPSSEHHPYRNPNRQSNRNPSRNNPRNTSGQRRDNLRPPQPHTPTSQVWPPWWQYPPPCPYPTQQGWATPWMPPPITDSLGPIR